MPVEIGKQKRVDPKDLLSTAQSLKTQGFTFLTMITAVCKENGLDMVYLLDNWETKEQIFIYTFLPDENLEVQSLIHLWKGADWLEREVYDMFGVHFSGHHNLVRILLEDDSEDFPLLKSFKKID